MCLFYISGKYYRVKERSRTVDDWQTKCFDKSKPAPKSDELVELCRKMGFNKPMEISFNVLNTTADRATIEESYGNAGVKVHPFPLTSTLNVNDQFGVTSFRPSRTASSIVPWTESDHDSCNQIEIYCRT